MLHRNSFNIKPKAISLQLQKHHNSLSKSGSLSSAMAALKQVAPSNPAGGGCRPSRSASIGGESWPMEDIDQGLSATFEGSLSGLGVELGSAAFNMSDAIMSLSPCGEGDDAQTGGGGGECCSVKISPSESSSSFSALGRQLDLGGGGGGGVPLRLGDIRFSFVLMAGTSPAVKINEEPLTYLNQGQPYEVKLAYASVENKPRLLKSLFRVSFHERRMQFMEREHLEYWRQSRPGERILEVDPALTYNTQLVSDLHGSINSAEVVWEGCSALNPSPVSRSAASAAACQSPSPGASAVADCGVFVKLNCISTEFTARKHGGEKGVPFRLQIDTFDCKTGELLCCVAAQVKVFKPKGADRKHKTDREKLEKRSELDRCRYQPALPFTPFAAVPAADGVGGAEVVSSPHHHQHRVGVAAFSIVGDTPVAAAAAATAAAASAASAVSAAGGSVVLGGGQEHQIIMQAHSAGVRHSAVVAVKQEVVVCASHHSDEKSRHFQHGHSMVHSANGINHGASSKSASRTAASSSMSSPSTSSTGTPARAAVSSLAGAVSPTRAASTAGAVNLSNDVASSHQLLDSEHQPALLLALDQFSDLQQVADWLEQNRFPPGVRRAFLRYSGSDMLRLSRADLVEICGPADGIRLSNAIRPKPCRAKLMFYVGQEAENVFHPVYLNQLTYLELFTKVTGLFQSDGEKITQVLGCGPADIHVCINDEMVSHMVSESKYSLQVLADPINAGRFKIVMREFRTGWED